MRKCNILLTSLLLIIAANLSYAQSSKVQEKERQELVKESKNELNKKASKVAKKEAKRFFEKYKKA